MLSGENTSCRPQGRLSLKYWDSYRSRRRNCERSWGGYEIWFQSVKSFSHPIGRPWLSTIRADWVIGCLEEMVQAAWRGPGGRLGEQLRKAISPSCRKDACEHGGWVWGGLVRCSTNHAVLASNHCTDQCCQLSRWQNYGPFLFLSKMLNGLNKMLNKYILMCVFYEKYNFRYSFVLIWGGPGGLTPRKL